MSSPEPSLLSNQLLELYGLVGDCAPTSFQDAAMRIVRGAIEFDAFVWLATRNSGSRFEVESLHAPSLIDAIYNIWPKYRDREALTKQLIHAPNRSIAWCPELDEPDPEIKELWYGAYSIDSLALSGYEAAPNRSTIVGVGRIGRQPPLRQHDADVLGILVPHLASALRLSWFSESYRYAASAPIVYGRAYADADGWIHLLDDTFAPLVQLEWPDWHGPRLPPPLRHALDAPAPHYAGERISAAFNAIGTMCHVEVRQRQLRDRLTDRERRIAELYANGMHYKEIGRKLQLAPSTIRTRLSTIYLKLDVSTKAALSSVLQGKEKSQCQGDESA